MKDVNLLSALDSPAAEASSRTEAVSSGSEAGLRLMCSARACHEHARWTLLWNNPKLHTADRRKTWLACDAHRESLADFLQLRGFLREVRPAPVAVQG